MVWATPLYLPILNEAYVKWNVSKKKERAEVVAETAKRLRDASDQAAKAGKRVQKLPSDVSKA
jgi:hypothetical protein